jgi:hypothetical protein
LFDIEQIWYAGYSDDGIANVISLVLAFTLKVTPAMEDETLSAELARLRDQQYSARQNEVYGGLSKVEQADYDARANRIYELTKQVAAIASSSRAQAEQRREWNKSSETDIPQSEARQPYRSREKDSTTRFVDSLKTETFKQRRNPKD